jgi:ectoine hydroxylase
VVFFDSNLLHASANNLSPDDRVTAIVTYNSVHNLPRGGRDERPDFLVNRDPTPVTVAADDAMLR